MLKIDSESFRSIRKLMQSILLILFQKYACFFVFLNNYFVMRRKHSLRSLQTGLTESFASELPIIKRVSSKKLGQGGFAEVYEGDYQGKKVALKTVKQQRKKIKDITLKILEHEANLLKNLSHPNLIKMITLEKDAGEEILVFQLLEQKNLGQIIAKHGRLTEREVISIMKGITHVMCYLNENGIIHRDIKPSNVCFLKGKTKLIDFGCSVVMEKGGSLTERVGTTEFMSPEMLDRRKYGFKTDVWSFGILIYFCLFGKLPWAGRTADEQLQKIRNNPLSVPATPEISEEMQLILKGCLTRRSCDRFSWQFLKKIMDQFPQQMGLDINPQLQNDKNTEVEIQCCLSNIFRGK